MPTLLTTLELVRGALGRIFLVLAVVLTIVCAIDWLVRSRRLDPFGAVARFFRRFVQPLMAPIERAVVRSGGLPSSAPWWALGAVVVAGIGILTLLDFLRGQVGNVLIASRDGPRGYLRLVVVWTFALLQIALIVRVISSWIRVSSYSKWIRWSVTLTEPILRPLRQVIPTIGMMDLTPIVAYLLLGLLQRFVVQAI